MSLLMLIHQEKSNLIPTDTGLECRRRCAGFVSQPSLS